MQRRTTVLFLVIIALMLWSLPVFATSSPTYRMKAMSVAPPVKAGGPDEAFGISAGRSFGTPFSVGATASPGKEVGRTYYDWQHNGSTGRQIGEANGLIQVSFMDQDNAQISPGRMVKWNKVAVTGSATPFVQDNGGTINLLSLGTPGGGLDGTPMAQDQAGYTTLGVRPNSKSVVFYHAVGALGSHTATVDGSAANGIFQANPAPQPVGAQYIDDPVIWPHGNIDLVDGDTVVHVVGTFSGAGSEFWYWRGIVSGVVVTWDAPVFIDTAGFITAIVESCPTNDEVAIVWTKTTVDSNFNDIWYQTSDSGGVTWNAPINITNYTDQAADPDRAYLDLDAVYDYDGVLHILWNSVVWSPTDEIYSVSRAKLKHWNSSRNTVRPVANSVWFNSSAFDATRCGSGANNSNGSNALNLSKMNLVVKPVGAGPGAGIDTEYIYAIWVQGGPTTTDCATQDSAGTLGGYINQELYWSVSTDKGYTWDRAKNMTGTETPDCLPGDCASENWVSAAAYADSGVYVSYTRDRHPAGSILADGPQGEWAEGSYMVMAAEPRRPVVAPVIAVGPQLDYVDLHVKPDSSASIDLQVENLGNYDLNYTVTVTADDGGISHVLVNGLSGSDAGTVVPGGAAQTVTITYDGLGLGTPNPEEFNWRLEITSNDSTNNPGQGGAAIDVNLNVFVAETWFTCVYDTISTGQHRLSVSSCLELGDGGGGGGMFRYADSSEWIFDASPVLAWNDGVSNLVYRDILWNSATDCSRALNQAFRAQSEIEVVRNSSVDAGGGPYTGDMASGTASSTDSLFYVDWEVYTFREPGLTDGAVMKYTITDSSAGNQTVMFGAAADLDVDSMSAANEGFVNATAQYVGAQGGWRDSAGVITMNNNYAAMFYIPLDGLCEDQADGAQVLDNVDFVYPENAYNTDSLYDVMARTSGWNGATWQADTTTDVNVVMVSGSAAMSNGSSVEMAFGYAQSDVDLNDLGAKIAALRFAVNPACALCPIEATGDVNNNGSITSADIIYLVGFVFKGGPAPLPCAASGDVNCNGSVTSADIIYLVGFVFKGGNPPCDVCTLIPGTWTCP